MKRMITILLLTCTLLTVFSSCGNKPDSNPNSNINPTIPDGTIPPNIPDEEFEKTMVAVSVPAATETVKAKDGTVLFEYTYQHISLVLHRPNVADKIILDFLRRVDSTSTSAAEAEAAARAAYNGSQNWIPYQCHITYSPMRIDHKVLSFFGNNIVYTGATHPERTCVSANYDMSTGNVLTLSAILADGKKTDSIKALVLEELSQMAEGDYLYEDYTKTVDERFEADPATDEAWYFSQTGLCFFFAPYQIAPYASGVVTVEIPFNRLSGLIREKYMPKARTESKGSVLFSTFNNISLDQFTNIAEFITDSNGSMFMAYTEGHVQDLRLSINDKAGSYTVFAMYSLSSTDGIMLQTTNEMLEKMSVSYKSGNEIVSNPLVR